MTPRVLLVDDEPLVLEGLKRQLRRIATIDTATSGADGLAKIRDSEPYAVIVSDMRMPKMNGAMFLEEARGLSPDSVRMVLSGQAELDSAIDAVNRGGIFRFLTKPCNQDALQHTIRAGIDQYDLVVAKRELLEKTLQGTVNLLNDILSMTSPLAQSRANRIAKYAHRIAAAIGVADDWRLRLSALLSQVGCITLPEEILARLNAGQPLDDEAAEIFASHPDIARKLLGRIPRLESIAQIVGDQLEDPNFDGVAADPASWDTEFAGALLLRLANEIDAAYGSGKNPAAAARHVTAKLSLPAELHAKLAKVLPVSAETTIVSIGSTQLRVGMILEEDLMSRKGMRLIPKGQEITESLLLRIRSIAAGVGVVEPFRVRSKS